MALSPMMQQYLRIHEQYADCLLLFRLGDFYELFFEDAKTASQELELTLTGKDCGLPERAPMCGVPFHAVNTYVEKLISIIERWNLTQYDTKDSGGEVIRWYRVRKSWADAKSQKGAYKILDNAKKCADQNPGYKVFDADGKVVYEPKAAEPAVKVPFLVKVSISDLNIRTGPGVNHSRVQFCPPGVYTIVAVSEGAGASMWGKLKSGIGWLSLDFCRRL